MVNCLIFSICYFWFAENNAYKTFTQIKNDHRQKYFQNYDIAIIIWYLVESFQTITLHSVRSIRFAKYVLSAKIWFVKTSTRIVKYESPIVKSNSDGSVSSLSLRLEGEDTSKCHRFCRVPCRKVYLIW